MVGWLGFCGYIINFRVCIYLSLVVCVVGVVCSGWEFGVVVVFLFGGEVFCLGFYGLLVVGYRVGAGDLWV